MTVIIFVGNVFPDTVWMFPPTFIKNSSCSSQQHPLKLRTVEELCDMPVTVAVEHGVFNTL